MEFYQRSLDAFIEAYGRFDITIDHGKGVYLYDINGKKYLDFYSGIGVNALGHDHPEYTEALCKQIHRVLHVSNYFNTVEAIKAAELVNKATGLSKTFFTNSGTEAVEGALKLARKYYYLKTNRDDSQIISLRHSFHGRSTGAVTLTGNPSYHKGFGPLISGVVYGDINDLKSVTTLVNERTSAIIVEPVQGEGGIHVCTPEFLQGLRAICDENDICLIFDEVQCGMGRTGTMMTYQRYGVYPDIVTLAKGLGAGVPIGAFVANDKVARAMKPGDHGSTYGGNPFATSACISVVDIFEKERILENVNARSKYLFEKLEGLKAKYPCIKELRGLGLMVGIELTSEAKPVMKGLLEHGVIVVTAGLNTIRLLPPLVITDENIDEFIAVFDKVLSQV